MAQREELLSRTFVDVADTLVADFDVVDFLTLLADRCVELFELSAAGLLLADPARGLRVAATSDHRTEVLEAFELEHDEGPSLDCYRTGTVVACDDLAANAHQWPRFAEQARASGWIAVY